MKANAIFAVNIVLIALILLGIGNIVKTTAFATQPTHSSSTYTGNESTMLFVMAFCPYGQQAEQAMKPVIDLLGSKVPIAIHYIVSVSGDTASSLHGPNEAKEDMRQVCIRENYDQKTLWDYIANIYTSCSLSTIDTCWKTAATSASIDTAKIETCVTNDGLTLLKAEEALSNQYQVSGSPTLIINGQQSNAARTPEGYKLAICDSLASKPAECSQTIGTASSSSTTASGGCG